MEKQDAYKLDLKGMLDDVVTRSLVADDDFFAAVQGDAIQHGHVALQVQVRRGEETFDLALQFQGEVEVSCDRCLEPMLQPVEGEALIKVRLGDTYEDDGETVVLVTGHRNLTGKVVNKSTCDTLEKNHYKMTVTDILKALRA